MLVYNSRLIGTPILSVQAGGLIGHIKETIVDPNDLKIVAFKLSGPLFHKTDTNILAVTSIREYSNYGMVIDSTEELVSPEDVVKIKDILDLNFNLIGLKAETKKKSKLGKVIDFTASSNDFSIQQIVVKRPLAKSFLDPELIISRKEIVEITDYKVIIKDEEKVIKEKAEKEDFVPNFVNPFRKTEQVQAPIQTESPDDKDTE